VKEDKRKRKGEKRERGGGEKCVKRRSLTFPRHGEIHAKSVHAILCLEHSTALHHTQSTTWATLPSAGRSVSILFYIPRSFRLPFSPFYLGPPVRFSLPLSISVRLSLSFSVFLSLSLSLSPSLPPPRSRRQEKSFVVGLPFLRHLPLALGSDDRAVSMSATPRSGTTTVMMMTTATATSPMARVTRDVIRRKRKKKRKRLPAARARARERDDPASSYARDSVWATTEERICAVPAQAFVPVLTRHGATVDHPFRRGRKRESMWQPGVRMTCGPCEDKDTRARVYACSDTRWR